MTHDDAFLADIVEHADEDGPRLVYADWLDDRGEGACAEFVRVQVELARLPAGSARGQELHRRQLDLLRPHAERWAGGLGGWVRARPPGSLVDQPGDPDAFYKASSDGIVVFRRGFVDQVGMGGPTFAQKHEQLLGGLPVTSLSLSSPRPAIPALVDSPASARLRQLSLWSGQLLGDDLQTVLDSPHLTRLRLLSVGLNPLGEAGAVVLAGAGSLNTLQSLRLSGCGLNASAVQLLTSSPHLTGLTTLHLDGNLIGDDGADALAGGRSPARPEVLYLQDCRIADPGVYALAASERFSSLTRLFLHGRNPLGTYGLNAIAQSPHLANLRELYLQPEGWSMDGAMALAKSPHLNRLTLLQLSSCGFLEPARLLLRERFGNVVVFD